MNPSANSIGISVLMPTYNQDAFIGRAISSLLLQTFKNWELIIVNDGSTDNTVNIVQPYLTDSRIHYIENRKNIGLGASLNIALKKATYNLISYLPSDDVFFKDHLTSLHNALRTSAQAIGAISGVRHHYTTLGHDNINNLSTGKIADYPIQLVQVLHKKTDDTWMEREELVTDDLEKMFWNRLKKHGTLVPTNTITCEWVEHTLQRHKLIDEKFDGGLYIYKRWYNVDQPIRFQSTTGNYIDEIRYFMPYRKSFNSAGKDPLKILIVGELSYNSERIYALEEKGHKLYGLWLDKPSHFNAIGPLPFGNVETIQYENWIESVKTIKPDIIYALLNTPAVPFAHKIMLENPGIPFVWHYKEGPFHCRQIGYWKEMTELLTKSDGQIFINEESKAWFNLFLPASQYQHVLDGDLPKKSSQPQKRSTLLSELDGEIHTVESGRPMGISVKDIKNFADEKIHFHFYSDLYQGLGKQAVEAGKAFGHKYFHVHPYCPPENWVEEFSKYDAGWLHIFDSDNFGELSKATWYDLNYANRMSTLALAGIPMIQKDNGNHIVATQTLMRKYDIGVSYKSIAELGAKLRDKNRMAQIRKNVWDNKDFFTFDFHVEDLITFFRKVIEGKKSNSSK